MHGMCCRRSENRWRQFSKDMNRLSYTIKGTIVGDSNMSALYWFAVNRACYSIGIIIIHCMGYFVCCICLTTVAKALGYSQPLHQKTTFIYCSILNYGLLLYISIVSLSVWCHLYYLLVCYCIIWNFLFRVDV